MCHKIFSIFTVFHNPKTQITRLRVRIAYKEVILFYCMSQPNLAYKVHYGVKHIHDPCLKVLTVPVCMVMSCACFYQGIP